MEAAERMTADDFDTPGGDPFDDFDPAEGVYDPYASEEGIDRDRWDRPLILPDPEWLSVARRRAVGTGIRGPEARLRARLEAANGWPDGQVHKYQLADGRRPYGRISTMAPSIDPGFGLGIWYRRHIALSIARRPDLQALLSTMTYLDGKAIDAVCEEAMVRAKDDTVPGEDGPVYVDPEGKLIAATRGTAFHRFTDPDVVRRVGLDSVFGPRLKDFAISAERFAEALERHHLEIVSTERFVVADSLTAAGTYDHLVRDTRTGLVHVLDKKTGTLQVLSHIVQLEGYAAAKHYDPATGERSPLHEDFDPDTGFLASTNLKTGECEILELELDGSSARLAQDVWARNKAEWIKKKVRRRT